MTKNKLNAVKNYSQSCAPAKATRPTEHGKKFVAKSTNNGKDAINEKKTVLACKGKL